MKARLDLTGPQALIADYCFDPTTGQVNICELGSIFSSDRGCNGLEAVLNSLSKAYDKVIVLVPERYVKWPFKISNKKIEILDFTDSACYPDRIGDFDYYHPFRAPADAANRTINQIQSMRYNKSKKHCFIVYAAVLQETKIFSYILSQMLQEHFIKAKLTNFCVLNSAPRTAAISENKFFFMSYLKDKPLHCMNILKPSVKKIQTIQEQTESNSMLVIKPTDNADCHGVNVLPVASLGAYLGLFKELVELGKELPFHLRTKAEIDKRKLPIYEKYQIQPSNGVKFKDWEYGYISDGIHVNRRTQPYAVVQPLFPSFKIQGLNATVRTFFIVYPNGKFEALASYVKLANIPTDNIPTTESVVSGEPTGVIPQEISEKMLAALGQEILKIYRGKELAEHLTDLYWHADLDVQEAAQYYSSDFLTPANKEKLDEALRRGPIKETDTFDNNPETTSNISDADSCFSIDGKDYSMFLLSGFVTAIGITAVAIAFAVLNASTLGSAGFVVAAMGSTATILGTIGLFAIYPASEENDFGKQLSFFREHS